MSKHEKLDYIEYPAVNLLATKQFFEMVFGWEFVDYGPDYTAFSNQGLDGGFYYSELSSRSENGGALAVFYSDDLQTTCDKVKANNGDIVTPIFAFPGGHRFQFVEPSGNEFAVWSDTYTGT